MADNVEGAVFETRQIMERYARPAELTVTEPEAGLARVVLVPDGMTPFDPEAYFARYRERPLHRSGEAVVEDLDSLTLHVNRFKDEASALYAWVQGEPGMLALYDYHEPTATAEAEDHNGARFCRHRCRYAFPLSEEWHHWMRFNATGMSQEKFAEFLEDRAMDLLPAPANLKAERPPGDFGDRTGDEWLAHVLAQLRVKLASPNELVTLSRELSVLVEAKVASKAKLQSGETQIVYEETHRGEGGEAVTIPGAFLIGIPFFVGGARYRVLARLRYRPGREGLSFFYELHDVRRSLEHAVRDSAKRVAAATGLPLIFGRPE